MYTHTYVCRDTYVVISIFTIKNELKTQVEER